MHPPLRYLAQWRPFRLDALGLLTMLGGPEMSQAIGHLTFNRYRISAYSWRLHCSEQRLRSTSVRVHSL